MREALALVLAGTVAGGFASLALVPPNILGAWFYRITGMVYGLLCAIAWWVLPQSWTLSGWLLAGVLALYLMVSWTPWTGLAYPITVLGGPVGLAFMWGLAAATRATLETGAPSTAIITAHFAISGLMTGSGLTAMLFGHWYLTTPGLPTRHLRRLHVLVMAALIVSAVWCAAAMWREADLLVALGYFKLASFGAVFLWARLVFGFGAAGAAAGMTWYCLREDSVQAATGFLYLVVCFSLMGELLSRFLLEQLQLPL